jgi:hypothetical protein
LGLFNSTCQVKTKTILKWENFYFFN